jgi:hypothetical protein
MKGFLFRLHFLDNAGSLWFCFKKLVEQGITKETRAQKDGGHQCWAGITNTPGHYPGIPV